MSPAASRSCRRRCRKPGHRSFDRGPAGARGFTLVEVLVAASITALLSVALAHLLSLVLDLTRTVRAKDDLRRDAQLAVALVRRDVSQARAILSATEGAMALVTDAGDTVHYALDLTADGVLERWVNHGTRQTVAAAVDTAAFALRSVSRPYTDERMSTVTADARVAKFEPGDWDQWVARTICDYDTRLERKIGDSRWCAEEFWPTEGFDALTRAALRIKARDQYPTQVDVLIRVYTADVVTGYPSLLLAEGRIPKASVTQAYTWIEVPLTTITLTSIVAGGHYWIIFRHDGTGSNTYAGHVEVERLKNCDPGDPLNNYMFYRQSDNAGGWWDSPSHLRETFFRLYGQRTANQLVDQTQTIVGKLGIDYRIALRRDSEREYRAGYLALHNL
jgi:prepilin-type N-terminal cleavage/methylation domain-containing protein